jgi:hypothetical protein
LEPWEHRAILRASRYPDLFRYTTLRADRGLESLGAGALMAFAEEALGDRVSRRVDIEDEETARRMGRYALRRPGRAPRPDRR